MSKNIRLHHEKDNSRKRAFFFPQRFGLGGKSEGGPSNNSYRFCDYLEEKERLIRSAVFWGDFFPTVFSGKMDFPVDKYHFRNTRIRR